MIIDYKNNFKQYTRNIPELYEAVKFAEKVWEDSLPVGRYPVGDNYALIQEGTTRPVSEGKFEVHRRYLDIQFLISGMEYMEYAHLADLFPDTPYDDSRDVEFLNGTGNLIPVKPGMFYIAYPEDAHKPCVHPEFARNYKKVVVKVRIDKLIHGVK